MTVRTRKLIGAVSLLALIIVYSFLAIAAAAVLQTQSTSKLAELMFYLIAGLLWTVPAGAIIWWMQRSPPA